MFPSFKFFSSFLTYKINSFIGGTRITKQYIPKITLLKNIPIKNKKLAAELEIICKEKYSITFGEFLQVCQYGKNGYYARHKNHGMTDTYLRWNKPLVNLCKKYRLNNIVEFGCGDGMLALETLKTAKSQNIDLSYTGIEINKAEVKKAERFINVIYSIEEITLNKPSLLFFSYSLDSIPPELFVNTTNSYEPPNAMIGIRVKNGLLSECLIPVKMKPSRELLHPWQRAYMPIAVFKILTQFAEKAKKGSVFLIIDEFAKPVIPFKTQDLFPPYDLDKFSLNRKCTDVKTLYTLAGDNFLYFPGDLQIYISVLKSIGIKNIIKGNEKTVREILTNDSIRNPRYRCLYICGRLE